MENRAIGICIVALVVVAAVALAIGMATDDGQGDGDSQNPGVTVVEYSLDIDPVGTESWAFDVSFYAPVSGSLHGYLGDVPLGDNGLLLSWDEPTQFRDRGWSYDFGPGEDLEYVEKNLRLVFSSNIDPVRVDH